MKLKAFYATEDEIPEGYRDLYTERNGQWELTGVEGVKTQADVDRVSTALRKEREDHKKTKELVTAFGELNPDEVHQKLENYDSLNEQLEALKASGGKALNDEQVESIVATRVKAALGPVERQRDSIQKRLDETIKQVGEREARIGDLQNGITMDRIERAVRDAAAAAKVLAPAINDAVLNSRGLFEIEDGTGKIITKDVNGVTPGLSPAEWLKDQQEKAPHWWPASVGGGAGGGGPNGNLRNSDNPWSAGGWNITKQGAYVKQFGIAKASEMAARVGSKVGATQPPKAA
jgi:hypothetical protein